MGVQIGGLIGLYGGATFGILGWWLGRHFAKKNRGLDELYYHIWQKDRSISWYFTLFAIYVLFSLVLFGINLSIAAVLGIIMLVHIASWGISGMILSMNYHRTEPIRLSELKMNIVIAFITLLTFTIISIVTSNWKFLIASIPPAIFVTVSAFFPNHKRNDETENKQHNN